MVTKKAKSTTAPLARQTPLAPIALVTGASSGIGEELAHCFARAGHDVILVARSAGKLQALAQALKTQHGVTAHVAAADLAVPGAAAQLHTLLSARLAREHRSIDVLVNCAGVLSQGAFTSMTAATHQQMIDLNISGLTAMLSAFVPDMVAQGKRGRAGRILNVASIAAFQPIPMLATYAAGKAYVLSLSESLSEELKGTGVTVTALCPGITATNMLTSAAGANDQLSRLPGFLIGDVKDVAQQAYAACLRGDVICIPGAVNRIGMLASRATPKWLVRAVGGLVGRKSHK
jgi:short-subunit dehydrogenase